MSDDNTERDKILMDHPMDWDEYFMTISYVIAMKSKDPSSKVGAVIVNKNNEIVSTGYNGLPRKVSDFAKSYEDRHYKYIAGNHAEENAIINAARVGVSTGEGVIYTPWFPCAGCARMIIQSGIRRVVYDGKFPGNLIECPDHWQESIAISRAMLTESGVEICEYNSGIKEIMITFQGRKLNRLMEER